MNEEIEKTSRSGADSISNDIVAGQTQTLDVIDEKTINNEVNNKEEKIAEIETKVGTNPVEKNININVKKKTKKEMKNRNTRSFLLLLIIFLIIFVTIGLIYLKIKDLKEKYELPKEVESVFEEDSTRKEDDELKYVVHLGDTFDYNDLEFKTYSIIDGVETEDLSNVDFSKIKDQKHYIVVSGLKDKIVQDTINTTIKNEVMNLASENYDGKVYSSASVIGNFGNILSISIAYPVKYEKYSYANKGLNFDLNTGNIVPLEDVFVASAPIKTILYNACMEALAWDIDTEAYYRGEKDANNFSARDLSGVDDYGIEISNLYDSMKGKIDYSISPRYLTIYNFKPSFLSDNATLRINLGKYSDYIAIYKRYATTSSIYERDCCVNNAFAFVGYQSGNGIGKINDNWLYESNGNYIENVLVMSQGYTYQTSQIDLNKWKEIISTNYISNFVNKASSNLDNRYYITGNVGIELVEPDPVRTYEYQIKQRYALYKGAKYCARISLCNAELVNTSSELFAKILYAESKIPRSGLSDNPIKDLEYELYKQYLEDTKLPTINYDTSSFTNYYDSNYNYLFNDLEFPSIDEMVRFIDDYESIHNYGS